MLFCIREERGRVKAGVGKNPTILKGDILVHVVAVMPVEFQQVYNLKCNEFSCFRLRVSFYFGLGLMRQRD